MSKLLFVVTYMINLVFCNLKIFGFSRNIKLDSRFWFECNENVYNSCSTSLIFCPFQLYWQKPYLFFIYYLLINRWILFLENNLRGQSTWYQRNISLFLLILFISKILIRCYVDFTCLYINPIQTGLFTFSQDLGGGGHY